MTTPTRTCSVDGCKRRPHAKGMCNSHYSRFVNHGDPLGGGPPRQRGRLCSIPDCGKRHEAHGYCAMHYERLRRYGDVGEVESRRYSNSTTECIVPDCGGPVVRLDMCNRHALRFVRHGDPLAGASFRDHRDLATRYVDLLGSPTGEGCRPWQGYVNEAGYPWVRFRGRSLLLHRFVCELHHGTIAAGLVVDHVCHNLDLSCAGGACPHRACLEPAHLEAVTYAENNRRAWAQRKARRLAS